MEHSVASKCWAPVDPVPELGPSQLCLAVLSRLQAAGWHSHLPGRLPGMRLHVVTRCHICACLHCLNVPSNVPKYYFRISIQHHFQAYRYSKWKTCYLFWPSFLPRKDYGSHWWLNLHQSSQVFSLQKCKHIGCRMFLTCSFWIRHITTSNA